MYGRNSTEAIQRIDNGSGRKDMKQSLETMWTPPLRSEACRATGRAMSGRVLVVEDLSLMAVGLRMALLGRGWDVEASSGQTLANVASHAAQFQPHSVLLSVRLGGGVDDGISRVESLVATGANVLLLTAERRRTVLARFLEAGASGWIGKDVTLEDVDSTLDRLANGESIIGASIRSALMNELRLEREQERRGRAVFADLTQREALVLAALTDGLTADEIAREHFVAVSTIRSQIRGVLQKLDVRSQLAAVSLGGAHRELLPQRSEVMPDRRHVQHRLRKATPELSAITA